MKYIKASSQFIIFDSSDIVTSSSGAVWCAIGSNSRSWCMGGSGHQNKCPNSALSKCHGSDSNTASVLDDLADPDWLS